MDNALIYRGYFSGDLNNTDITPGYYSIGENSTISNGPPNAEWCTLVVFRGPFKVQMMVTANESSGGVKCRKWTGNPPEWHDWM